MPTYNCYDSQCETVSQVIRKTGGTAMTNADDYNHFEAYGHQ